MPYGGIQDVNVVRATPTQEGFELVISYKVPYTCLGFSKSPDFWETFRRSGGPKPILEQLDNTLFQNIPQLNKALHALFGGNSVSWAFHQNVDDTRVYAMTECTPDLLIS